MARFKIGDKTLDIPETFTMGEACDVEQYLGIDFSQAKAMQTSLGLCFIAHLRENPDQDKEKLAYELRQADVQTFDVEDDAGPPDRVPPASSESGSEKNERSGEDSEESSDLSTADQNSSGDPSLVTPT